MINNSPPDSKNRETGPDQNKMGYSNLLPDQNIHTMLTETSPAVGVMT